MNHASILEAVIGSMYQTANKYRSPVIFHTYVPRTMRPPVGGGGREKEKERKERERGEEEKRKPYESQRYIGPAK